MTLTGQRQTACSFLRWAKSCRLQFKLQQPPPCCRTSGCGQCSYRQHAAASSASLLLTSLQAINIMTLFIVLLQVLLTVGLAVSSLPPAAALSYCYFGLPFMNRKDTRENDVRLLPVNFLEYPYCFSYQQQCTQNMAPDVCSQTEVDQGNVWKWYFGLSYSKFPRCEEYVGQLQAPDSQAATYRNYTCCTTDGCNLPLPSKAPGKRVLPYPVDLFPSSMEHPRPNPTCYDNLFSDDGTLMPVVSSIEYTGHNEANANYVCARFKYQCAEAGVYCSAEEQAEHHTKWIYTSVTADNCFGWQSSAELYNMSQVMLCSGLVTKGSTAASVMVP